MIQFNFKEIKKRLKSNLMNIALKHLFILAMITPISTNAEFTHKAEKATLSVAGLLSVYSAECGDLTDLGNKMFGLIVADQEKKGRLIWNSPEYIKSVNLFRDSVQIEGLSESCKYFKDVFKKAPIWNKAIK